MKHEFDEEWRQMLADLTPMFGFPNGDICYINYNEEAGTLETGSVTNAGFCYGPLTVTVAIDYDRTLLWNMEGLYDEVTKQNPELLEEPDENGNS